MIVTYDGETMSACVYGGHIFETAYEEDSNIVMGAVGDYQPIAECFDMLTLKTPAAVVAEAVGEMGDAMVLHKGQLMTLKWFVEHPDAQQLTVKWEEVTAPYAIASNQKQAIRAIGLMMDGMNASQACSKVISEVAEAGGMVNTQTVSCFSA